MSKQQKKAKQETLTQTVRTASSHQSAEKSPLFYAGILAAIAAILYLPSLGHGFVLDDPLVTTLNAYVQKGFAGLGDIFTHSYRAGSSVSTDSEYMYRPLSVAMFAIEWGIAPKTAGIHHFMNVLWYALSVGLLFLTLRKMLGERFALLAFGASLLFAVHPLHTEVVANIKSRDEIMSFFFSALTLYWLWDSVNGQTNALWKALGAFFLALLSKEGAVSILVVAPLALYFLGEKGQWKQAIWLFAPFILWFAIRFAVMGKTAYTPDFNDNQLVAASLMDRWATGFLVLGNYLKLLLWPSGLSWDYSFNQIPTANWSSIGAIVGLVLHAALLGFGIWGWKKQSLPALCALAYLASIGLYSNLLMLIGTIMGDRLTYQASLWFCLAVAYGVWQALKTSSDGFLTGKNTTTFLGALAAISLVLAVMSFSRESAWKSNYTLVTTDVKNAPQSFRLQQAVGEETLLKYVDKSTAPSDTAALLKQSLDGFQKSHAIRPTFNNLLGLGNVAYFKKDYPTAVKYFEESYKMQPGNLSKDRLVTTYREWGRYEGQVRQNLPQSALYLEKSYAFDSTDTQTLRDLGTVYGMMQRPEKAVVFLEKAVKAVPNDQTLLQNLALAWQQLGRPDKAAEVMQGKR